MVQSEDVNSKRLQRWDGQHDSEENCEKGKGGALGKLKGMWWERGKSEETNSNSFFYSEGKSRKWSLCFT